MKTDCSGELTSLERIPGIRLIPCERNFGFFWNMTEEEKKEAASVYQAMLEQAERAAVRSAETKTRCLSWTRSLPHTDMGWLTGEKFLEFLKNRPENLEVVMTGRDPAPELTELADYVSEIRKVKHPFDRGIHARKGIEF